MARDHDMRRYRFCTVYQYSSVASTLQSTSPFHARPMIQTAMSGHVPQQREPHNWSLKPIISNAREVCVVALDTLQTMYSQISCIESSFNESRLAVLSTTKRRSKWNCTSVTLYPVYLLLWSPCWTKCHWCPLVFCYNRKETTL